MAGAKMKVEVDAKEAAAQLKELRAAALDGLLDACNSLQAVFAIKNRGERVAAIQAAKAKLNSLREGLE